ncbi:MAG: alpha/beta hydrolase [Geminicoccaceae bacterium]
MRRPPVADEDANLERLAPDMLAVFQREQEQKIPADDPVRLPAARAQRREQAGYWAETAQPIAQVEDHEVPGSPAGLGIRLFRQDPSEARPVILFIHGGGWALGGIEEVEPAVRHLAHETGSAVAAVRYRLAPEHPYPAGLEDCLRAYAWLLSGDHELSLDTSRTAIVGDSAGANLALALALARRDRGQPLPQALGLIYGVFGAELDTASYNAFGDGRFGLSKAQMKIFFDWYDPGGRRNDDPLIQPLLADVTGLPPTWLGLAELDVLRDDTLMMARRLTDQGVEHRLEHYPGVIHGFINRGREVAAANRALSDLASSLRTWGIEGMRS